MKVCCGLWAGTLIQVGAGSNEKERCVLEDHNIVFTWVAETSKIGLSRSNHDVEMKNAEEDGSAPRKSSMTEQVP